MALSPAELGQRLVDALALSGIDVVPESSLAARPLILRVRIERKTIALRVFIWRITHGGATRSEDEYRVQTTRPNQEPFLVSGQSRTLLLGYHEGLDVFAAWSVESHPDPAGSSSLQVSLEELREASESGITSRLREISAGTELVMAFRPDAAGAYVEAATRLRAVRQPSASAVVEAATRGGPISPSELPKSAERRREIRVVAALVRDQRFRASVTSAYDGRCAFCGFDLGLIEAAHIEGVAEGGPDTVDNGLALCPTHHEAFDRGLVLVGDDGSLLVNAKLATRLGGKPDDIRRLRTGVLKRLRSPSDAAYSPDPARLQRHRGKWQKDA